MTVPVDKLKSMFDITTDSLVGDFYVDFDVSVIQVCVGGNPVAYFSSEEDAEMFAVNKARQMYALREDEYIELKE